MPSRKLLADFLAFLVASSLMLVGSVGFGMSPTPDAKPGQYARPSPKTMIDRGPSADATSTTTVGFALIVTNNQSLDLSRPDLHYADDDGVQFADLFGSLYGPDRVVLLTDFDAETRALHPEWEGRNRSATRRNLDFAVGELRARIQAEAANGRTAQVHIVMAGHGDIEAGVGFVEFRDERFYARDLESMVSSLHASRVHIILDSCNAYFMLNPRSPSAPRFSVDTRDLARGLLENHPEVGVLISTSAEAVTYEWSEIQSGIFSYEIRSAFRGAADANGDGRIAYAEVEAFIARANEKIPNELYRPKVYVRGPSKDADAAAFWQTATDARRLRIEAEGDRRLTLRDANGSRILDLHKEDGTRLSLLLPVSKSFGSEILAEELVAGPEDRPRLIARTLDTQRTSLDLDEATAGPALVASRGEAPVFKAIFREPFGKKAFAEHRKKTQGQGEQAHFGVTRHDLDKLHAYLEASAAFERDERIGWGVMGSIFGPSVGLTGVGLLKLSADVKDRDKKNALRGAGIGLAVTGGVTLGVGLIELLVDSESEEILRAFQSADVSTEAARAEALFSTEALWHERVERVAAKRRLVGGAAIASGILYGAIGTYFLTHPTGASGRQSSSEGYVLGGTSIALGLATLGAGIYVLDRARHPVERTWDLYTNERVPSSEAATGRAFSIAPSILGADGFGAVAAGRF